MTGQDARFVAALLAFGERALQHANGNIVLRLWRFATAAWSLRRVRVTRSARALRASAASSTASSSAPPTRTPGTRLKLGGRHDSLFLPRLTAPHCRERGFPCTIECNIAAGGMQYKQGVPTKS